MAAVRRHGGKQKHALGVIFNSRKKGYMDNKSNLLFQYSLFKQWQFCYTVQFVRAVGTTSDEGLSHVSTLYHSEALLTHYQVPDI